MSNALKSLTTKPGSDSAYGPHGPQKRINAQCTQTFGKSLSVVLHSWQRSVICFKCVNLTHILNDHFSPSLSMRKKKKSLCLQPSHCDVTHRSQHRRWSSCIPPLPFMDCEIKKLFKLSLSLLLSPSPSHCQASIKLLQDNLLA